MIENKKNVIHSFTVRWLIFLLTTTSISVTFSSTVVGLIITPRPTVSACVSTLGIEVLFQNSLHRYLKHKEHLENEIRLSIFFQII